MNRPQIPAEKQKRVCSPLDSQSSSVQYCLLTHRGQGETEPNRWNFEGSVSCY